MVDFAVHHEIISAPGAEPQQYLYVLHGVYGSGANWRSFMRKLVTQCPAWGAVLVDVRGHAHSLGAPPPHTMASVADDLILLESRLPLPVHAVVGHSLGGKLALSYAERRPGQLTQVWVLDSSPERLAADGTLPAQLVMHLLRGLPASFDKRDDFISTLTERGVAQPIAQWLAMNLRRDGAHYRLMLELDTLSDLLESYYSSDMWSALERTIGECQVHLVVGTRSYVWTPAVLERLDALASSHTQLTVHRLDAGHWIHVDAADALLAQLTCALGSAAIATRLG